MGTGEIDVTRDYHGNFTAELFEFWFKKLCQTLQACYGQCLIHMDGASYHKRRQNRRPTVADNVPAIQAWLTGHGVSFLPKDKKHQLLARIPVEYQRAKFFSQVIAEEYGHKVIFTPPYHPELEPIEIIWGVVKNRIAANPARTMAELGSKIVQSCQLVTRKTWLGARKKTMRKEDEYWASVDLDLVADGNGNASSDDVEMSDVITDAALEAS
jgi:hypothetical protein